MWKDGLHFSKGLLVELSCKFDLWSPVLIQSLVALRQNRSNKQLSIPLCEKLIMSGWHSIALAQLKFRLAFCETK